MQNKFTTKMKIPTAKLDEYRIAIEEFNKLQRKDFDGGILGCFLIILLHIVIPILIGFLATQFFNCNKDTTKNVVLFYIFVPYCWAISFGILSTFEDLYTKYYRSFSHKSEKYLCFKELKEVLPNLKLKVEDQITDYFHNELLQIIKQLRTNSENSPTYELFLNVFKENDSLIKESVSLMKDKTLLKKYRGILRQNNVWFEDEIKNEETKKQNSQNLPKHSIKETKTFSSSSYNLLGLSEPIQRTRQTQPIEKDNQIEKTSTIETPRLYEGSNRQKPIQPQNNISKQQTFNFDELAGELERTKVLPERRKRLTRPRTIKASDSFWEHLGKRRIEIGKRGELLVLNDEKKRIIREEGKEYLQHLEHSSVVQGDGLGYDITSILEGEKIFIEVKTTTGSFDADLTFTKNEIEVMRKLGDKYFLYRVYEFNTKTNEGKLHLFKGCEEIESFFDFTPQTFTLRRKN